ncbi:MAG: DUF1329 domain-containing protein [Halieaceae bacterium]
MTSSIFSKRQGPRLAAVAVLLGALHGSALAADAESPMGEESQLTPVGAQQAGNPAGTIPSWDGGLKAPVSGYQKGERLVDPYAEDPVLFTITGENQQDYAENLTEGQKALLNRYPDSWRMNVYASHRSAAYPERVYKAVENNRSTATAILDGRGGVKGSAIASPFPVPESGVEVIWNHILRWRGVHIQRMDGSAAVTRRGNYTLILQQEEWAIPYALSQSLPMQERNPNLLLAFKTKVLAPGFLTGSGLLTVDSLNHNETARENWLYNADLRRIIRAPFSGFDNPSPNTDALRFTDEGDMFNGAPGLFDWKLLGKRELYIPYNAYRLESGELTAEDIVGEEHINPDHARYELHRVWVVEGTLKTGSGQRGHRYSRRVFYLDEDTWQIAAADNYDADGNLWRVSEGHAVMHYQVPAPWYALLVYHDLKEERYLVQGLDNQRRAPQFDEKINPRLFGPNSLSFYVR